ncbi:hypothetical protein CCMA1212_000979 [Trichoderma ghanense]|uniref:Uncharacterized protein n=1 Tax=Trichoderma ghanense TaxID=65468 RepID=A0ABY2HEP0_9HYPO
MRRGPFVVRHLRMADAGASLSSGERRARPSSSGRILNECLTLSASSTWTVMNCNVSNHMRRDGIWTLAVDGHPHHVER